MILDNFNILITLIYRLSSEMQEWPVQNTQLFEDTILSIVIFFYLQDAGMKEVHFKNQIDLNFVSEDQKVRWSICDSPERFIWTYFCFIERCKQKLSASFSSE